MLKHVKHIVLVVVMLCSCHSNNKVLIIEASQAKLINGVLFYKDMPYTGLVQTYFEGYVLKSDIQYEKGKKQGAENHWYKNGSKLIARFYLEGLKSGIHKSWWKNGYLKFVYHFNTNGEYQGSVKEWYKTGQIYKDFNYIKGKEVGRQRLWRLDGAIRANYDVVNGERFGLIGLKKCYTVTVGIDDVK